MSFSIIVVFIGEKDPSLPLITESIVNDNSSVGSLNTSSSSAKT